MPSVEIYDNGKTVTVSYHYNNGNGSYYGDVKKYAIYVTSSIPSVNISEAQSKITSISTSVDTNVIP